MTVLDKYSKEELVHIVDMFRIDMKMEDLRKSKKDILKVMKDKKVDKKHGDKLPSKTAVKEMVKKDKKNPKSSLSKLQKAGTAKGQKKITDLLPKKKKPESKNDKGGAKPPEKKATSKPLKFEKTKEDAKKKARSEATSVRRGLTERFSAQAKNRTKVLDKKKKENKVEKEEQETDAELAPLKGKKLQDKIEEIVDLTSNDDERARIYFKFGTPAIFKSSKFMDFIETYIDDSNLNEDNLKFTKKEKVEKVRSEFRKNWESDNPNRDFNKMMNNKPVPKKAGGDKPKDYRELKNMAIETIRAENNDQKNIKSMMSDLKFDLPDEIEKKYPSMSKPEIRKLYDDNKDKLEQDLLKRFPSSKNPQGAKKKRRSFKPLEKRVYTVDR